MFFCREKELSELNELYNTGTFQCVVIYGRRRVGKTSLITEFCKDKPTVFFSALEASSGENLEALSGVISDYKAPGSPAPVYRTYGDALSGITELSKIEHLIFVIDEYPYLARAEKSISSRLQHIIDHVWKSGNLFLILCGSSMSFMENQILGYESPLYGRRTAQFKVLPLSYRETAAFNPQLGNEDQALVFGVTGGTPHYINSLGVQDDMDEALKRNFFRDSCYLFGEPENLLKQELREPAVYNSVIAAIAQGATRQNEIASKAGLDRAVCSKYLKVLLDLGILRKETPITEKPGKKTIYSIRDNLFRFWYRFVPMNMSAISSGRIERNYDLSIKPHIPGYMGLVFEQMCREYLLRYADDLPFPLTGVGQWWGTDPEEKKEVQIDIVGTSADPEEFIIGSCKYRNEPVGTDELELLRHYADVFGKGRRYHYCIFSKSGFTRGLAQKAGKEDLRLVSLDDLYRK